MKKSTRFVIKSAAVVSGLLALVSVCAVDSMSWIPTIVCFLSIGVFALCANKLGWMRVDHD